MLEDPHILVVPDGTEVINTRQYANTDYECIFIPRSVKLVKGFAFDGCKSLKEVVIEEGSKMRIIGKNAFRDCSSLAKITLPEGLVMIDLYAF